MRNESDFLVDPTFMSVTTTICQKAEHFLQKAEMEDRTTYFNKKDAKEQIAI